MGDVVRLLRLGVVGPRGMLGRELLTVIEGRKLPVMELLAIGSAESAGDGVEFQGDDVPLHPPETELSGLDALFLCAPGEESLEYARRALHARVACFDLSGALLGSEEVPLLDAEAGPEALEAARQAPCVSVAGGPSLAWHRVLAPLDEEAGLRRVSLTALESVSTAGQRAFDALSAETIALLSQQEAPDADALPWPIAFDCHAATGEAERCGASARESELGGALCRLLGRDLPVDCTVVRIPPFSGEGAALTVETERPLAPEQAATRLAKVPALECVDRDPGRLRTRASTGRDTVQVGRLRAAAGGRGLMLWLAADTQRLTALNAVRLAEARFGREAAADRE